MDLQSLGLRLCPYDKNHKVKTSRYQQHISKCAKRHEISNPLEECPFNAGHRFPKDQIRQHMLRCPDSLSTLKYYDDRDNNLLMKIEKKNKKDNKVEEIDKDVNDIKEDDGWGNSSGGASAASNDYSGFNKSGKSVNMIESALGKNEWTAEEVFEERFIKSAGKPFNDSIHVQRMIKSERKKYQQMVCQKIRELQEEEKQSPKQLIKTSPFVYPINASMNRFGFLPDLGLSNVISSTTKKQKTNQWIESNGLFRHFVDQSDDIRMPKNMPFATKKTASDSEPSNKFQGIGRGRAFRPNNKPSN
ncbi:uncharacterized protein LOC128963964 [Oppia nitens]|uniref:uncharacterized protein LOC128963964 n=1 Tax=Oppia nitens TaxID=1686743 RepID=UPI0023D99931|nr:uncharacterized protein LOC128963964 [Oppia nitens]